LPLLHPNSFSGSVISGADLFKDGVKKVFLNRMWRNLPQTGLGTLLKVPDTIGLALEKVIK
jgi:hypothetical protein